MRKWAAWPPGCIGSRLDAGKSRDGSAASRRGATFEMSASFQTADVLCPECGSRLAAVLTVTTEVRYYECSECRTRWVEERTVAPADTRRVPQRRKADRKR